MKNIVFGMIGMLMILYTTVIGLEIYGVYGRKDELENSLAAVMKAVMQEHYASDELRAYAPELYGEDAEQEVEAEIREELALRLKSASDLNISITDCDLKKGILGVVVEESFTQINGEQRKIAARKVLIAESRT